MKCSECGKPKHEFWWDCEGSKDYWPESGFRKALRRKSPFAENYRKRVSDDNE